jgi:ATP-dependent RNA helicase SUPV3L1/SUV3
VHPALAWPQVQRYTRLAPLVVQDQPLGSLAEVQPGDCIVAFSRRELHGLRRAIERRGRHRCSMVRGVWGETARVAP